MNIFYLHEDPATCAEMHVDKHCVKMIVEYAQLLSTTHRVLDGTEVVELGKSGRKVKRWRLSDEREKDLYLACHINHPSSIWLRKSDKNYKYLFFLYSHLCDEYTYRYEKIHKTESLKSWLSTLPNNIPTGNFTQPTPAMPEDCKIVGNSLTSYRKYYIQNKSHIAKWKKRSIPDWYITK